MRLTRGAWFLLGFGLTLGVIWTGASVWTLLEEQGNGNHLTKIERIVVGLNRARKAPDRGGDALQPANAGQQPTPAKTPAHKHGGATPHPQQPKDDTPKGASPPGPSPAPTGEPAGEAPATSTPAEESAPESSGGNPLLEAPGIAVGEQHCPVKALGVSVCTE